jgi:hypothetical protein
MYLGFKNQPSTNTYYDFLYTKIYMHDCFDLQGAVHGLQNSRTKTDSSTILKGYFFFPSCWIGMFVVIIGCCLPRGLDLCYLSCFVVMKSIRK